MTSYLNTPPIHILIVEDEKNLAATLCDYLSCKNYICYTSPLFHQALNLFKQKNTLIDVIIVDINLPDGNGLELARQLIAIKKNLIVLFLSVQSDPQTRVRALEDGAFDFITKPFNLKELSLRLNRIISAHHVPNKLVKDPEWISLGPAQVSFEKYLVKDANGQPKELSAKECALLKYLYTHKEKVVTRDELLDEIWGTTQFPSNRTIDNYIVNLRKLIESKNDYSSLFKIKSIRGVGYKLTSL